jgi:hypothetical protein
LLCLLETRKLATVPLLWPKTVVVHAKQATMTGALDFCFRASESDSSLRLSAPSVEPRQCWFYRGGARRAPVYATLQPTRLVIVYPCGSW